MKGPIFVYEPEDLDVFASVESVERYIEPIDVKNCEFEYFDSEGKILKASTITGSRGIEQTIIREDPDRGFDRNKLKEIIVQFLSYFGTPESELNRLDLEDLVKESQKYMTR